MAVRVDEIHSEVATSAATPDSGPHDGHSGGHEPPGAPTGPGATEELWRSAEARVTALRARVAAQGFDD